MNKALLALAMVLVGTTSANAATVVATCRGSVIENSTGEIMTFSRDGGKLIVDDQYNNTKPVTLVLNSGTVREDSASTLKIVNIKKRFVLTISKKSLWIDFTTGHGELFTYQVGESAAIGKKVFLTSCTR